MTNKVITRRELLKRSALLPAAAVLLSAAGCARNGDAQQACYDPSSQAADQVALRDSLKYMERAADPRQSCSACAFFTAAEGGCGHCTIFNGPANPQGHCNSWSQKPT
jgi:hypothetical protein